MHAVYRRNAGMAGGKATFRASFPAAPILVGVESARQPDPRPEIRQSEYGARRRPSWAALALIAIAHGGLIVALAKLDAIEIAPRKAAPLVVELISVTPAPPPAPVEQKPEPVRPVEPRITAPLPVVVAPAPPPPVAVVTAPPSAAVVVTPPAPVSAPPGPVSVVDLSAKLVSATPPRYPLESRRRREQGRVLLAVLLGPDGTVAEIGIAESSGHARLDKAALDAVRRWRWSPTLQNGKPAMVRGIVDIPFVLRS